jgi:hypothetical protein
MSRNLVFLASFLVIGCAPKGSFDGKLLDPVTGKARAGVTMLLLSPTNPSPSCMELEGVTGDDGSFLIEGLCGNGDYTLGSRDKTFILQDIGTIPGGVLATGTVEIEGWPFPNKAGLFTFDGESFSKHREGPLMGVEKIWKSEEDVVYPDTLPTKVVNIANDEWLVFHGAKFTERFTLEPLLFHDEYIRLGKPSYYTRSEPWWYVGTEFENESTFTRVEAKFDESKVKTLVQGDTHLRFVKGDAVPNGFYVSYYEGFRDDPRYKKLYMVNMGPELKAPGAE